MLVPFQALDERQLASVLAIYEEALAAPWEWPAEDLAKIARTPDSTQWAQAALDGDETAGFIINQYLPGGRLWYIHYFAVRADLRGGGWGSRILSAALPFGEEAARQHGHSGCVGSLLEVEAVTGASSATHHMWDRRQQFYRRHGAIVTGARYPRPPEMPPEMPDFDLLFIPGRGWDGRLDNGFRRTLVRSLMVEGYETPADAPWLMAELARYAE